MPFRTEKQRKWMWANKPAMAENGQRNMAASLSRRKKVEYFMQKDMILHLGLMNTDIPLGELQLKKEDDNAEGW